MKHFVKRKWKYSVRIRLSDWHTYHVSCMCDTSINGVCVCVILHLQRSEKYKPVVLINDLLIACVTNYNLRLTFVFCVFDVNFLGSVKVWLLPVKVPGFLLNRSSLRVYVRRPLLIVLASAYLWCVRRLHYPTSFVGLILILSSCVCIDLESGILYSDFMTKISMNSFCMVHSSMLLDLIVGEGYQLVVVMPR